MKQNFSICSVSKRQCKELLFKYHYLKDISRGFKSGYNYGLFHSCRCVGIIIYTAFPVPELSKGMLGLERNDQEGLFELSRLCLCPDVQKEEKNLASWFVSRTIRKLKSETKVRVILSYADADYHNGTVYQACNFKYYGLTDAKKDFWIRQEDGSFKKHNRGTVKGLEGEWRWRSRKHRYALVFDKTLRVLWPEVTAMSSSRKSRQNS
jgi:hypothetical protein